MSDTPTAIIWHNRNCSKSRGACDLLTVRGVEFETRDYIKHPPTRAELEGVLKMMGDAEPSAILRVAEDEAKELGSRARRATRSSTRWSRTRS